MLAYERVMYHFHIRNSFDNKWVEGNEIIVDKKFNIGRRYFINNFSTGVPCIFPDGIRELPEIIELLLSHIDTEEKKLELKELDKKSYLHNMEMIQRVLNDSSEIIKYAGIYNLETALEETRAKYYEYLPSRLNSMFVTDDNGIEYWYKAYSKLPSELYEVSLTGTLFKTSAAFTPPIGYTHLEMLRLSHEYWNPKFINEDQESSVEYLFNGKAKVLRKIKKFE